jgi:uncharacterized protein (DUF2461 family)
MCYRRAGWRTLNLLIGQRIGRKLWRSWAGPTAFYEGLEPDNSKAYWLDHKEVHERDVKAPMDALLAELTSEFAETKLFRPYRDTRFRCDKSPFRKTQ